MHSRTLIAVILAIGLFTAPASAASLYSGQQDSANCPEIIDLDRSDSADLDAYTDCKRQHYTDISKHALQGAFNEAERNIRTIGEWLIQSEIPGTDPIGKHVLKASEKLDREVDAALAQY